jgi:hypothetical protein
MLDLLGIRGKSGKKSQNPLFQWRIVPKRTLFNVQANGRFRMGIISLRWRHGLSNRQIDRGKQRTAQVYYWVTRLKVSHCEVRENRKRSAFLRRRLACVDQRMPSGFTAPDISLQMKSSHTRTFGQPGVQKWAQRLYNYLWRNPHVWNRRLHRPA